MSYPDTNPELWGEGNPFPDDNSPEKQKIYVEALQRMEKERVEREKQEADRPRKEYVKGAMEAGCPSEEFANFLWKNRCTQDRYGGDFLVGIK